MEALRSSLREMEVCLSCALLVYLCVYSHLYRCTNTHTHHTHTLSVFLALSQDLSAR